MNTTNQTKIVKTVALIATVFTLFIYACQEKSTLKIGFLDEYIISDTTLFQNKKIGGLSGVSFVNNKLYFIVDDAKDPKILASKLYLNNKKIDSLIFTNAITIGDTVNTFFNKNILDLEDVFFDAENSLFYIANEGSINYNVLPSIFSVRKDGSFQTNFSLPKSFRNIENYKHNGTFEALSNSVDSKGIWVATEAPLKTDGEEPTFTKTKSPVRITYFDKTTKNATKQYAYHLDKIDKPAKGAVNLNGVTAILEFKKNTFFVLERAYQNNYGSYGNTIKLYLAEASNSTSNVIEDLELKNKSYIPLQKTLLLNFNDVKENLTEQIVDNLEGITLGPILANGNQTLLLVADDNFQLYGRQLNQIILLEIQKTNQ